VPDYIAEDPLIQAMGVTKDQVVAALQKVGFTDDLLVRGLVGCILDFKRLLHSLFMFTPHIVFLDACD
jgi:hypothetical protein